jgi:hypothetical protein
MRAGLGVLFALGVGTVVVGCILVTGGTNGYAGPDTGVGGGPFVLNCMAPSDCQGGGADAAPQSCCVSLTLPGTQCQSSCAEPWQKLCTVASDCGDAATAECLTNNCTFDEASAPVPSCGPIPICAQ